MPGSRATTCWGRHAHLHNHPLSHARAQGLGVPGSRATTCEELGEQLLAALARQGPSLIEAVL